MGSGTYQMPMHNLICWCADSRIDRHCDMVADDISAVVGVVSHSFYYASAMLTIY